VWNRQPSQAVLVDPADTGLGHRQVQRWNLPEGWVISKHPAHTALVSEGDFIAAQDTTPPRGPVGHAWATALVSWLVPPGWPDAEVGRDRTGSGARQSATPSMTPASRLSGTAAACRVVR
jgi:hypothetical protein